MKNYIPSLISLLTAFALVAPKVRAQDETYDTNTTSYESADASSVTYDQPVAYYASVVYQAPVIYNAPVYYVASGTAAAIAYTSQCQRAAETPASTVVVVGGRGGTYSYTSQPPSCEASVVIQFGQRGSSWFAR